MSSEKDLAARRREVAKALDNDEGPTNNKVTCSSVLIYSYSQGGTLMFNVRRLPFQHFEVVPGNGGGFMNAPVLGLYRGPSGTQSSPVIGRLALTKIRRYRGK